MLRHEWVLEYAYLHQTCLPLEILAGTWYFADISPPMIFFICNPTFIRHTLVPRRRRSWTVLASPWRGTHGKLKSRRRPSVPPSETRQIKKDDFLSDVEEYSIAGTKASRRVLGCISNRPILLTKKKGVRTPRA